MGWKAIKDHYRIAHAVQIVPGKGVCIGSAYIHDIIVVGEDGKITKRDSAFSRNDDLARYQAEIDADPAKFAELLAQPDNFERSIPVFTYEGGKIIECACEELGWPHVTHDGRMMYENTFSADRAEVVRWAFSNARAGIRNRAEMVARVEADLAQARRYLAERQNHLIELLATEKDEGERGDDGPAA